VSFLSHMSGARLDLKREQTLVRSMLATVTGLVVAFFAGFGWYLAGKLRSEALTVGPGPAMPAYDDVQFVGLSPGKARLRALDRPGR
jgi:hypothetical protein